MASSQDRHVTLPSWLDDLLFNKLSATYCKKNKDLVVLDWKYEDILCYLGTYFPRSYAEAFCIFNEYFESAKGQYLNCTEFSVFDFGCGTGGELVGFICAVSNHLPNIKKIKIQALDGNSYALRSLEKILYSTSQSTGIELAYHLMPVVIDDFYDMKIVTDIITEKYDFIISFKAICEFVTRQQFDGKNPYEHIINIFTAKLNETGIVCLADVTSFSDVSKDWLPKMLDKASDAFNVELVSRNSGFNEEYRVSHSRRRNDISKIAWRIYKPIK